MGPVERGQIRTRRGQAWQRMPPPYPIPSPKPSPQYRASCTSDLASSDPSSPFRQART